MLNDSGGRLKPSISMATQLQSAKRNWNGSLRAFRSPPGDTRDHDEGGFRRLRRLEESFPQVDLAAQRLSELLRERGRRRLEASGEVDEPLDWGSLGLPPGTRLSESETARLDRQLRLKRDREREERARLAAISKGAQN